MIFDLSFAAEVMPELARGLGITVLATLGGMGIALFLGAFWALMQRSSHGALRRSASFCVQLLRNTPLLIQLYFVFYVSPELGFRLPPLVCGILGLGLHYSAYLAEVYRAGIENVARGQWEAALALNLSPMTTFTRVILPQALIASLPALGNRFVGMFKDTPLMAAITVSEILHRAKVIGSETFRYVEPMTLVGVLFLTLTLVASYLLNRLERRLEL